jgi:hypothetical protein
MLTNILEERAASIIRVKVSKAEMQRKGKRTRSLTTYSQRSGRGDRVLSWPMENERGKALDSLLFLGSG